MSAKKSTQTIQVSPSVLSAIREYEKASRAYNYDCNRRRSEPPDAKRRKLSLASRNAFKKMCRLIKQLTNKSTP